MPRVLVSLTSALLASPLSTSLLVDTAHHEYGSLVRDLSVSDKVITQASRPTDIDNNILGTENVRLLETQKELNTIKKVRFHNTRLKDRKRRAEVQSIQFDKFKRRKMAEVGNRGAFDTEKKLEVESAGLVSGYTDILSSQPFYKTTLIMIIMIYC